MSRTAAVAVYVFVHERIDRLRTILLSTRRWLKLTVARSGTQGTLQAYGNLVRKWGLNRPEDRSGDFSVICWKRSDRSKQQLA